MKHFLFCGPSGSGKTSILEAVNIAIAGFFGSQEQKMQRGIEFDEIKITNGKREIQTSIISKSDSIKGEWSRTIKRDTKSNDKKGIKSISDYGAKYFKLFDTSQDKTIAPLIAFYSTQRLFKDASLSGKQKYDAANDGWQHDGLCH